MGGTEYVIGVDGGGTKTDYLIFTTQGEFVDSYRVGSRSHEVLEGGFAEAEVKLLADLDYLLQKNSIQRQEVAAAAFGLAGMDTPAQLTAMYGILEKAGFRKYVAANDSVLGIKAGCPSGIGICSINGTGCVVTGINEKGEILQIGGIGLATGDYAGGSHIAALVVRAAYDYYYRCGGKTILTDQVMKLFGLTDPKKLHNTISEDFYTRREFDVQLITMLFEAANAGDAIAVEIVQEIARQQAKSVGGCIKNLSFPTTPELVLAGSVWTKSKCPLLISYFTDCIFLYTGLQVRPILLEVKPAAGAVLWAMELAYGCSVTEAQRDTIIQRLKTEQ